MRSLAERLVVDDHCPRFNGSPPWQRSIKRPHPGMPRFRAITTIALGDIKRLICPRHQRPGDLIIAGDITAHANTDRYRPSPAHTRERPRMKGLHEPVGENLRPFGVSIGRQYLEFLATNTGNNVAQSRRITKQHAHLAKYFVSREMTKLIINTLEVIDINRQDR